MEPSGSAIRASSRRPPASKTAAAAVVAGTQITNMFPKSSSVPEPPAQRGRKRAIIDSTADPQPSTSSTADVPVKRTLRENLQRNTTQPAKTTTKKTAKDTLISKFFQRDEDVDDDDIDADDRAFESPKKKLAKAAVRAAPAKRSTRATKPKATASSSAATKPKATKPAKGPAAKNMIRERFFSDAMAEHGRRDGVDADELQLALAISRSLAEPEADGGENQQATASTKVANKKAVHEIFQKFGFREGCKEFNPTDEATKPTRTTKAARGRWATKKATALTQRLPDVQTQKMRARLARLTTPASQPAAETTTITTDQTVHQMTSEYLVRFYIPQRDLVELNGTADRQPLTAFYTNRLCEMSTVPAGALLRSWSEIAGRDSSPEREARQKSPKWLATGETVEVVSAAADTGQEVAAILANVAECVDEVVGADCSTVVHDDTTEPEAIAMRSLNSTNNSIEPQQKRDSTTTTTTTSKQTRYWQSVLERSQSPDMFASDSDGGDAGADGKSSAAPNSASVNRVASSAAAARQPSSEERPCSLDPIPTSSSGSLESPTHEEDRLIQMYHEAALARNLTATPDAADAPDDEPLHSSSSDSSCSENADRNEVLALPAQPQTECPDVYESLPAHGSAEIGPKSPDSFCTAASGSSALLRRMSSPVDVAMLSAAGSVADSPDEAAAAAVVKQETSVSFVLEDVISLHSESEAEDRVDPGGHQQAKISNVSAASIALNTQTIELSDENSIESPPNRIDVDTSTDEVDFSFASVASGPEAPSRRRSMTSLHRQVMEKSLVSRQTKNLSTATENASLNELVKCFDSTALAASIELSSDDEPDDNEEGGLFNLLEVDRSEIQQTPEHVADSIEISDDEQPKIAPKKYEINPPTKTRRSYMLDFSFPSKELEDLGDDQARPTERPSSPNDDEQFEFTMHLSKDPNPEESIEISDDEINYSMSHGRNGDLPATPKTNRRSNDVPSEAAVSITNESLQNIFVGSANNDFDDDTDAASLDQSVQQIVRQEFVAQTSSSSSSRTKLPTTSSGANKSSKFRRYQSEYSIGQMPCLKVPSPPKAVESTLSTFDDDEEDEFDKMLMLPQIKPVTKPRIPNASPPPPPSTTSSDADDDLQFQVTHAGCTYDIKIGPRCVSPKPDFEPMPSPERSVQLRRYGLKPLPRRKAIICLEHIYNRTHPLVEVASDEALTRETFHAARAVELAARVAPTRSVPAPAKAQRSQTNKSAKPKPDRSVDVPADAMADASDGDLRLYTARNPTLDSLPADYHAYFLNAQSEYYLPSAPRAKRPWCLQPLHTAWYNMLADNPRAFEWVLRYRPIELRVVRAHFKELGMLFDVNDLIAFFDKHCITFRTESTRTKQTKPSRK